MAGYNSKQKQRRSLLKRLIAEGNQASHKLWDQYLDLIQVGLKESQLAPRLYDFVGDNTTRPIFENVASNDNDARLEIARRVLKTLSPIQQKIIQYALLEGLTDKKIGTLLRLPRTTVSYHKTSAIKKMTDEIPSLLPCMRSE